MSSRNLTRQFFSRWSRGAYHLLSSVSRYCPPAVAKVYIVSFRSLDDRRPKFIVLANNMRATIKMAWERGGADFQSRFDKSTVQAEQMKEIANCGKLSFDQ
jgi:hypothetical protein